MSAVLIACGLLVVVAQGQIIPKHDVSKLRIIDGNDAKLGEIPYQVSLQFYPGTTQFCGGSILNEYWILTAAHCIAWKEPNEIAIIAGTVDLEEPFSSHLAEKIVSHDYEPRDSHRNDIALIKVATPFKFSSRIKPAVLPEPHAKVKTNSTATVSGWGMNSDTRLPDILQKAKVYITDPEVCQVAMQKDNLTIYATNICTSHPLRHRGDCSADSGGPVVVDKILVGIVSWSIKRDGCVSPRYPSVHTRVSEYIDWINEHIG